MEKFIVFTLTGLLVFDTKEQAYDALDDVCWTTPAYMWTSLEAWRAHREVTERLCMYQHN